MNRWLTSTSALFACACLGTPTPLAPGLSGTVGVPNHGVLTEAEELPVRGEGFVRYRPLGTHYFGRPRLVHALEKAAADVARKAPGGAPLFVGDLSAKTGGRIPGHDSHRSGRDVDLLFLVETPSGVPISSPGFVRFESDGLALVQEKNEYIRLDIDREWLLLRSLLTSPEIGVQFMFVHRDLEALLIDHARALGEPPELIWHAETVMLQPSDSLPHDDHVHLRIACSPEEAVAGCSGGGPRWEWLPPYKPVHALDAQDWAEIARDDPFELNQPALPADASAESGSSPSVEPGGA
ncbi:MAG TPA: penicillin-insensitive murein endopeptidase [Polyangiaceae bacterium]